MCAAGAVVLSRKPTRRPTIAALLSKIKLYIKVHMGKLKTIDTFFKKDKECVNASTNDLPHVSVSILEEPNFELQRINHEEMDAFHLERDPGLRPMIWRFPVNQRDEIHRAYLRVGPYQPNLVDYKFSGYGNQRRRFQSSWFQLFPSWLEYSPSKDAIYCLPCYLFGKPHSGRPGSNAFIKDGFKSWKKVNSGENCPLLNHVGKDPNSPGHKAVKSCDDLMKQSQHIDRIIKRKSSEEIENNRLRLKASIDCVKWLTFQACAFKGNDESETSNNRGNFIEMLKFIGSYNEKVQKVILENAPQVGRYTFSDVQKEILHIFASKVRKSIREEIGNAKFCIIVDEARDESKKEQMAIVLRFVDNDGNVQERFFDLVHVIDTSAATLKKEVVSTLSRHNLQIENIRGQGYDGASNMRGEWNGLQALILNECPYAYYVHCFAHRLQLALVAASKEVVYVHEFFSQLTNIVNIVGASCKRHDQLQAAQAIEIANMIANDELETGRGANQVGTLQKAGDTRRGSHYQSIRSLMKMYAETSTVINNIIDEGATYSQRGEAFAQIDVPDMDGQYITGRGRSRQLNVTVEHHYRVDIFVAAIDSQLQELNSIFNEQVVELLTLSFALNPIENYKSFKIEDICRLVENFYPQDFSEQEQIHIRFQLQHYEIDIHENQDFQNIKTLSELCQRLKETGKSKVYHLVDRLIRLVLTLPVSTATTERAFSAMKIVKTRLRNKIGDEFLANSLIVHIEKDIAGTFDTNLIIDKFESIKKRQIQLS